MLRKSNKKPVKTVSDKIVDELKRQERGSEDSDDSAGDESAPRFIDFDDEEYGEFLDAPTTDIRKRNVKLLSEQSAKYRGKIATRRDIEDDDDDVDDDDDDSAEEREMPWKEDSESDEDALEAFNKKLLEAGGDSEEEDGVTAEQDVDDDDDEDDDDNENEDDDDDEDEDNAEVDEDSSAAESEHEESKTDIIAETNRQAELQKGHCVQNQLRIWERLLELRIHMQKLLNKSNQLPAVLPEQITEQNQGTYSTAHKVSHFLGALVELQAKLTEQFSEMRSAMSSSLKRPLPTPSDAGDDQNVPPPTKRFAEHLGQQFEAMRPYRNAVLLKWDDRTRLTTPGAGGRRKTLNEEFDVIRKIDNALLQRDVLVQKSQIDKSAAPAPAETTETPEAEDLVEKESQSQSRRNVNIYDDSDFYHQQLRELIEYKANVSSNISEMTKQFVELQKMRQKMKKKVDTRASKGRKMRFVVHNKLINFMAPNDAATWTDDSKNELCKSLFAT